MLGVAFCFPIKETVLALALSFARPLLYGFGIPSIPQGWLNDGTVSADLPRCIIYHRAVQL